MEYAQLMKPGGFLSVLEHTGLILCDGVPLFKSSGKFLKYRLFINVLKYIYIHYVKHYGLLNLALQVYLQIFE